MPTAIFANLALNDDIAKPVSRSRLAYLIGAVVKLNDSVDGFEFTNLLSRPLKDNAEALSAAVRLIAIAAKHKPVCVALGRYDKPLAFLTELQNVSLAETATDASLHPYPLDEEDKGPFGIRISNGSTYNEWTGPNFVKAVYPDLPKPDEALGNILVAVIPTPESATDETNVRKYLSRLDSLGAACKSVKTLSAQTPTTTRGTGMRAYKAPQDTLTEFVKEKSWDRETQTAVLKELRSLC